MDSEKCLPRRHPATIESADIPAGRALLAVLLCIVSGIVSSVASAQPESAAASDRLEAFNTTVTSLTATFVQETWSADDRLVDEATGTFSLLRPGKFRWHTLTPYEHLVVADGTTLWMYDVDLEQATRSPIDAMAGGNPGLLLSGDRPVSEDYSVERRYTVEDRDFVELSPKDPRAEFSRLLVAFRGEALVALEIVDGLNQTTRIEFGDVEINPELGDAPFEFEPPAGVAVIGDER